MAKKVGDLKKGDVIVENGVRFTIDQIFEAPNGCVLIRFEDMPATHENLEAYKSLLDRLKGGNEKAYPRLRCPEVLEYQGDQAIVKWPDDRPRSYEEYRKAFSDLFCGRADNVIKEELKEDEH